MSISHLINPSYEKLVFTEKRIILIQIPTEQSYESMNDDRFLKAMTVMENMRSKYNIVFSPLDIFKAIQYDVMDTIQNKLDAFIIDKIAAPMYPNYPEEVMEMDEATFRFNQWMHYYSTYGMEDYAKVLGADDFEVLKGWLPNHDLDNQNKTREDVSLLKADSYDIVFYTKNTINDIVYNQPMRKILESKQRMTKPESLIVKEALKHVDPESMISVRIPFKENLYDIFCLVMDSALDKDPIKNRDRKIRILHSVCQHTGDVWKCFGEYLKVHHYHLKTSQKKTVVRLFETYPLNDFQMNLMRSQKNREIILFYLMKLDYITYSRDSSFSNAVDSLRDDKKTSWESYIKSLLNQNQSLALKEVSKHPGQLLRWVRWFMRAGVSEEEIRKALLDKIDQLSLQTLISLCNKFGSDYANGSLNRSIKEDINEKALKKHLYHMIPGTILGNSLENKTCFSIFNQCLEAKINALPYNDTLYGKKVFIDEGKYDFQRSFIETNENSLEGGYIRSGLCMKIPDQVRYLRFFTYWNDKHRIDIDLHSKAVLTDGKVIHVGWNADFRYKNVLYTSGDITHSNASEFLDIDMESNNIKNVLFSIDSFTHVPFSEIDTVLVGMMGVSQMGIEKDVKLYTPKNCFFSNELNTNETTLDYAFIDVPNRRIQILKKPNKSYSIFNCTGIEWMDSIYSNRKFNLDTFLRLLLQHNRVEWVEEKELADIVIRMDKAENEKELSLIDENFFLPKK